MTPAPSPTRDAALSTAPHAAAGERTDPHRRELARTAVWIWAPLLLVLVAAFVVTSLSDTTMRQLTQDIATVTGAPFYFGAVTSIGNVLWSATVAVTLFVAVAGRDSVERAKRTFLLVSGLFTAVLLFDDLFLLHDEILPRYAGISGELYGAGYVLFTLGWLVAFRGTIRRTNARLLLIALALFAVSTAVDLGSSTVADLVGSRIAILVEDGTKLLGIGSWLAYFLSVARGALAPT